MARTLVFLLLLLLFVSSASASAQDDLPEELQDCQVPLDLLSPCQASSVSTDKLSAECCGSFTAMKQYWPQCLCSFLLQTTIKSSPLYSPTHSQLLQVPKLCGIPHGISDCPAILGLPPNSGDSNIFEVKDRGSTSAAAQSPLSVGSPSSLPSYDPLATSTSKGARSLEMYRLGSMATLMGAAALILA